MLQDFILVLPDALGDFHAWNPYAVSPNNDLAFLTTLLETLPKNYAIDTSRVFVCGPPAMTYTAVRHLRAAGVRRRHIHAERFAL